jgi:hypothetical protein
MKELSEGFLIVIAGCAFLSCIATDRDLRFEGRRMRKWCHKNRVHYDGQTPGCGKLPPVMWFTDLNPVSASFRASFTLSKGCTLRQADKRLNALRLDYEIDKAVRAKMLR